MRKVLWGLVGLTWVGCGAASDPGYEPSYGGSTRSSILSERPPLPPASPEASPKIIAALQVCVDRFAPQLSKPDYYAVVYDVTIDVSATTAKVRESQIPESELEGCVTSVLERMGVKDIVAPSVPTSQVSPQSRSMVGIVQALAAPVALVPIVLVSVGVTILVAATIHVVAHAVDDVQKEKERCKQVKEFCISKCTDETLPTGTFNGDPFFQCRRRCLEAANCW